MNDLAGLIRDELTAVGLPVLGAAHSDAPDPGGVRLHVRDEGVWLTWRPGAPLEAASRAVLRRGAFRGDELHPAIRFRDTVTQAVNDAIMVILRAAGFEVRTEADEYHHPMELLVESRRAVPHWRDPIPPTLDGASGFQPGVKVRVLTGDFAGAELIVARTKIRFGTYEPEGYQLHSPDGDGLIDVAVNDVEFAADE